MVGQQKSQKKKKPRKLISRSSLLVGGVIFIIILFLVVAILILLKQGITQGNNTILFLSTVVGVIISMLGLLLSFFQGIRPNSTPEVSPSHSENRVLTESHSVINLGQTVNKVPEETHISEDSKPHIRAENLSKMPQAGSFYGRSEELKILKEWTIHDQCQVIALLGIGGIGKTSLVVTVASQIKDSHSFTFWFSLQNTPSLKQLLQEFMQLFRDQTLLTLPDSVDTYLYQSLKHLQENKCLLILDNFESIFQENQRTGQYREGYQDYSRFLHLISETKHQSCILITSREKPKEIALLEGDHMLVRTLRVIGLTSTEGEAILQDRDLVASDDANKQLVDYYSGNPLALKLASVYIREAFGGDTKQFLKTQEFVFGGIEELIGHQFMRISDVEKELLYWLAINREAMSVEELQLCKFRKTSERDLVVAISSLRQRSMVEPIKTIKFTLQPVIMEYVTELFVTKIFEEIKSGILNLFRTHALMLAGTKDYLRDSQIRLIVDPLIRLLMAEYQKPEEFLKVLLLKLHEVYKLDSGYAAGNILNILILLGTNLRGSDFSSLPIWQAYLQEVNLPEVSFANASFVNTVFSHTFGSIFSIALSPAGDLLAVGTANSEIIIWQTNGTTPLYICHGHTDWIRSVAFSPDGGILASGSEDKTIRLWDMKTGESLQVWKDHSNRVSSVAFSPDGGILASGSDDKTIRLWDMKTRLCMLRLEGHEDWIYSVCFHPDGKSLASGSEDQTVRIWNIEAAQCEWILHGHKSRVYCVAFCASEPLLASGSADKSIRLWDVTTGVCIQELVGDEQFRCLAFNRAGTLLAGGSDDKTVRLWDKVLGWRMHILRGHTNWVRSVAFSPDSKTLITGSEDQTIRLWEVDTAQCFRVLRGHTSWVYAVAFSPDGKMLASGGDDKTVCLWNVESGICDQVIRESGKVRCVAFSPDGSWLVSGSDTQVIRLWDAMTGRLIQIFRGHEGWIRSVVFSNDSQILVSSSEDKTIRLWDVKTGSCLQILSDHQDWVYCVVFNKIGTLLASASADQTVRIWDAKTGQCLQVLHGHNNKVCCVAFSPDGKLLASSSADQTIRLWNIKNGECVRILQGHTDWIFSLVFSPDGCQIASGSDDKTIRLWDVENGLCMKILKGHTSWIYTVAINASGEMLASGSNDGTTRLWSMKTGECSNILRRDRPYERMNINGAKGLTQSQVDTITALGAISS